MIVKPKVFFDTQIPIYVAAEHISKAEWSRVKAILSRKYRYCISFITLIEICASIANGSDAHFETNRERLRALREPSGREFLHPPGEFIRRKIFRLPQGLKINHPAELSKWPKAILSMPDRENHSPSGDRISSIGPTRRVYGFDFTMVARQRENGRQSFIQRQEKLRRGELSAPTEAFWSGITLSMIGIDPSNEAVQRLMPRISAEYTANLWLWSQAKTPESLKGYNFSKGKSDWEDLHQLLYLADDSMHFVTWDTAIKDRTKSSPQNSRILLYKDFLRDV